MDVTSGCLSNCYCTGCRSAVSTSPSACVERISLSLSLSRSSISLDSSQRTGRRNRRRKTFLDLEIRVFLKPNRSIARGVQKNWTDGKHEYFLLSWWNASADMLVFVLILCDNDCVTYLLRRITVISIMN